MDIEIRRRIPRWALPLQRPARYKGASGGRASGKSHFFADEAVEAMVCDPSLRFACIREVQRSLKFSAKSLVESKIRAQGVSQHFDVLEREIRRVGGEGVSWMLSSTPPAPPRLPPLSRPPSSLSPASSFFQ